MQNHKALVLTSQESIVAFASGWLPEDYLVRSFSTAGEVEAYVEGVKVMAEEGIELHKTHRETSTAYFDVSFDGGIVFPRSKSFANSAQARAFEVGLGDISALEDSKVFTVASGNDFERLLVLIEATEARKAIKRLPTVVIYKSADQITRVVASQGVRVIVLDADGVGLEEDAARTLQIGDQELYVSDLVVTGKVGESPYGEQGVDAEFVREVVKHVDGLPAGSNASFNKPGQYAEPFPILKSVPVKHWEGYEDKQAPLTHQIDIDDQRLSNGQIYLTVGALEGHMDNLLSVTAEVNTNPQNEAEHLPCMHVHFNEDALAFTAFKVYDKILLQPEQGVVLTQVQGPEGPMYIVE
ncbi:TPA: hypothetical protein ACP3ZG_004815 [Pseudomonas aeruginosa]|uniref:Uncharacterized protein n=1 Tax=Pseudomonas aeruginosa TaxID=287 RepID=A0A241XRP7_PSEAI|nr:MULTISPECIES: hypothetical protein [Pseudomonas]ELG7182289.1 hypothetical protein [Pseudomonas aeruginosa]MBI6603240.1 hypothetical protein [Pseudomonas sp. S4_EA_1b]MBI8852332.1 hypothetical protein [Pseudomonas aeruginosa]OBY57327.1 hypothetical protein A9513_015665 [Pseudomonas sp. AU12215]OTI63087.1 hypothetical protein CAZ10_09615 [Pseudomonas aeruginosa]